MSKLKTAAMLALISALMIMVIPVFTVRAEETLIWSGNVYSNGAPVTSPILTSGIQYRIVADEVFFYNNNPYRAADAQYYTTEYDVWNWLNHFPAPDGHSFLQINGMDVNWGPFSNGDTGHTYSILYIGTGDEITFTLVDWIDGDYNNNYCHLPVQIYMCPREGGYTPGFWKHNIGVALGYNPGEFSAFNDGTKLTAAMLEGYATTVGVTLEEAYAALSANGPGMDTVRIDMANAFNAAAGYGPFVDED